MSIGHPVLGGKPSMPSTAPSFTNLLTSGKLASIGLYKGKVRVMHSPSDKIEPGEILVARETDVKWLPAMKVCGAMVSETGGPTSHMAITARSMRKPCIVSVENATRLLKTGQIVLVDGNKAKIYSE